MDAVLLFEDVMQVVGLLSISAAWVGALWGSYAFWQSRDNPTWKKAAYGAWIVHSLGILGALGLLFYILLAHRFEFYYAWAHGSKLLPTAYTLAAVWEGQEGSFLLWVFWQVVLGWGIIAWRRPWEEKAFGLAGLSAWNAFLTTFLLGVTLPRWVMGLVAGGVARRVGSGSHRHGYMASVVSKSGTGGGGPPLATALWRADRELPLLISLAGKA